MASSFMHAPCCMFRLTNLDLSVDVCSIAFESSTRACVCEHLRLCLCAHGLVCVRTSYLDASYLPTHTCSYRHMLLLSSILQVSASMLHVTSVYVYAIGGEARLRAHTHTHTHNPASTAPCAACHCCLSLHVTHTHTHTQFEVVVFTASLDKYANPVLDLMAKKSLKSLKILLFEKSQNSLVCYLDALRSAHTLPHHLTLCHILIEALSY